MRRPLILALAALAIAAAPAAANPKDGPSDEEIMTKTATYWAGLNCGKMIPEKEFWDAMKFWQGLEKETAAFALRRVQFMTGKASNRQIACISVLEAIRGE